ncbi:MAG: hypothetical protein ACREQ9_15760 [Candidatus Binatia bacterium]
MTTPGSSRAHILAPVVVVTAALLVAGVATLQLVRGQLRANADQVGVQQAFYVADAGIHRGLAQLDQDRATASTSLTYSYSTTESLGSGSYTVSIAQESLYPSDPTRKQIQSTAQVGGSQSSTVAHVLVQDDEPCAICFSDTGSCRIVSNVAAGTSLFNGLVHSNSGDVSFNVLAGLAVDANGTIRAGRDLISNNVAGLLSTLGANAFRVRNYVTSGTHADLLGNPLLGIHFNNGTNKHGVQQAITARRFPRPSYDRVRRSPETVIVNADNPPPFGSWDAASGTWVYSGTLVFPSSPDVTYYVDGNASLGSILLAGSTNATVVTRGWLAFQSLNLVTSSVTVGVNVNIASNGVSSSTVLTVSNGSAQNLHLVAEEQVAIGMPVLSLAPVTFDSETNAMLNALTGIGLSAIAVGSTTTNVIAYSETSTVWAKIASVTAASVPEVSLIGKGDTTLAYTGNVASNVTCPF